MVESRLNKNQILIGILILYYLVGLGMFLIEGTRAWFYMLTPFSLIMTFGAVLLFQTTWSWKYVTAFFIVFLASLMLEIIGVNTGVLFGHYVYGTALGVKILGTPLLIGLNWLILVYSSSAIVNQLFKGRSTRILTGSLLMVGYDLLLEYVAPVMKMWSWETPYPGIRNFAMWFFMALIFHTLFQSLDLRIVNKPARYLFLIQFLFFACIAIYTFINS